MLYKSEDFKDSEYNEWRYFCECGHPTHVLVFQTDIPKEDQPLDPQIYISVVNYTNWPLLHRIKKAFLLLLNKEISYVDIVINQEDRKELAKAIAGEENNDKKKS